MVLKNQSNLARVRTLSDIPPADGAPADGKDGNDGTYLAPLTYLGSQDQKTGMYMLEKTDLFNLMCIPPDQRHGDTDLTVYADAASYCQHKKAFLIVDPPIIWTDHAKQGNYSEIQPTDLDIHGDSERFAAVYFPRVVKEDLVMEGHLDVFPACGIIAGVMANTDATRGVWKAPAGQDAGLVGVTKLSVNLTDPQNGVLNPLGINCLRNFPIIGPVVWGARTLRGADLLSDDYKYVNVRRLTNFIEDSLYRGTQWAVFEPNDEELWSALRLSIGSFMSDLNRQGAFYNYHVTCDATTTTARDIELGIVDVIVAFDPVKPAEFVVLKIQQFAGQTTTSRG